MKRARKLRPGDTIAVIRPASRLDEGKFQQSLKYLRELGYCAVSYPRKLKSETFFAASDQNRADEFLWAMTEPGIHAVLAARGGYGSVRLVQNLSQSAAAMKKLRSAQARIFVGYSDCSYLHQWIQNQLGWVSYHGPLVGFLSLPQLKKFTQKLESLPSHPSRANWKALKAVRAGDSGPAILVGGNLSLLELTGSAALPQKPIILAIEDINENHYRIDRMLRRFIDAGYSKYVKGILLGTFKKCGQQDQKIFPWARIEESLMALTKGPILKNSPFGHGLKSQELLALGCRVRLRGGRLEYLEAQALSSL